MEPAFYIGLISGTSADGIDAALVSFEPTPRLHAALTRPYPDQLREHILRIAQSEGTVALDELGFLESEIGQIFAEAALNLLQQANLPPSAVQAIGSHGQTLRHRPYQAVPYTLQVGDPNMIAELTGITTVADFRRRDIAAGGQGAPLVPAFHNALLARSGITRVILNLGGIANITVLPSDENSPIMGFDTGPANCLLDAWAQRYKQQPYDLGGEFARSGQCNPDLLMRLLNEPYFALPPPKSTGREIFHLSWLEQVLTQLSALPVPADVQATLLELTAQTITDALQRNGIDCQEMLVCGGGVHNSVLMNRLRVLLHPVAVKSMAEHGIDPDYIEAMAFAWLARERLEGRPGNLSAVTGAKQSRILGGIYAAA